MNMPPLSSTIQPFARFGRRLERCRRTRSLALIAHTRLGKD